MTKEFTIIVRTLNDGKVIQTLKLNKGLNEFTNIDQAGYEIIDDATQKAPKKITAEHDGNDLNIKLDDDTTFIIKDYYQDQTPNSVIGIGENGKYGVYQGLNSSDNIQALTESMHAEQLLKVTSNSGTFPWYPVAVGAAIVGGIGLAVATNSGSSSDDAPSKPVSGGDIDSNIKPDGSLRDPEDKPKDEGKDKPVVAPTTDKETGGETPASKEEGKGGEDKKTDGDKNPDVVVNPPSEPVNPPNEPPKITEEKPPVIKPGDGDNHNPVDENKVINVTSSTEDAPMAIELGKRYQGELNDLNFSLATVEVPMDFSKFPTDQVDKYIEEFSSYAKNLSNIHKIVFKDTSDDATSELSTTNYNNFAKALENKGIVNFTGEKTEYHKAEASDKDTANEPKALYSADDNDIYVFHLANNDSKIVIPQDGVFIKANSKSEFDGLVLKGSGGEDNFHLDSVYNVIVLNNKANETPNDTLFIDYNFGTALTDEFDGSRATYQKINSIISDFLKEHVYADSNMEHHGSFAKIVFNDISATLGKSVVIHDSEKFHEVKMDVLDVNSLGINIQSPDAIDALTNSETAKSFWGFSTPELVNIANKTNEASAMFFKAMQTKDQALMAKAAKMSGDIQDQEAALASNYATKDAIVLSPYHYDDNSGSFIMG